MIALRGDVLLADIPYSDHTGSKKRPVVVVSMDANNAVLSDLILVAVSSKTRVRALTHLLVDPTLPAGLGCGLLRASYVQCENVFVLDRRFDIRRLGKMSTVIMGQIDDLLKVALALS